MNSVHHKFSPSSFPMFEKCLHYESGEAGEPAIRGTMQHQFLEFLGRHYKNIDVPILNMENIPESYIPLESVEDPNGFNMDVFFRLKKEEIENVIYGFNTITFLLKSFGLNWKDAKVETQLIAMANCGTMVFGAGDVVAVKDDYVLIFDYKSGQERDYSGQLKVYAYAGMQETGKRKAILIPVYGAKRKYSKNEINYNEAGEYFNSIVNDLLIMDKKPPVANDYCTWCKKKNSCKERNKTFLALRDRENKDKLKGITVSSNLITISSTKLSAICQYGKVLSDFVKDAESELKKRLKNGEVIAGWSLYKTNGRRSIKNIPLLYTKAGLKIDDFLEKCTMNVKDFDSLNIYENKDNFIKIGNGSYKLKFKKEN